MWALGKEVGIKPKIHSSPSRRENVMASYASLSLAWSELGSAPALIRSCYG